VVLYSKRNTIVFWRCLIPIFNKHKIIRVKLLDFCLAIELVNKKAHSTLGEIKEIKIKNE